MQLSKNVSCAPVTSGGTNSTTIQRSNAGSNFRSAGPDSGAPKYSKKPGAMTGSGIFGGSGVGSGAAEIGPGVGALNGCAVGAATGSGVGAGVGAGSSVGVGSGKGAGVCGTLS